MSLIQADRIKRLKWTAVIYGGVCVPLILFMELRGFGPKMLALRQVDLLARNTFGLIGGLAAAYGMVLYAREIKSGNEAISRNFQLSGILLAVFTFFESFIFENMTRLFYFPMELLRTAAIVLTAHFIMKALNIFDVETRKKVGEQARQLVQSEKLASLGQLATGIAHEINNPLANASLGIHMLKNKLGKAGEREAVERLNAVGKNIERAALIAQELLTFSHPRETEFLRLDINKVIASALLLVKYKLKAVSIEQNLAQVPEVMGNSGKLVQVFINILSNAVEAMPNGGRISISTSLQNNGMVEVRITDTGTGIPEEKISRIFEPFYTTKEVGLGTGLGLSISYGIIQQHHGSIKITSAIGQGTTVTIQIPRLSKQV